MAALAPAAEAAAAAAAAQSPVVGEVISSEVEALLEGKSLAEVNAAFLEVHGTASLRHRAAAAEMALLLKPEDRKAAVHILLQRGGLLGAPKMLFPCQCASLHAPHLGRTSPLVAVRQQGGHQDEQSCWLFAALVDLTTHPAGLQQFSRVF